MAWSQDTRKENRRSGRAAAITGSKPPPDEADSPPPTVSGSDRPTYGQILKSSALIGGSSVVNIGIGIVRTKAMAVLLGPAGMGLMGLYGAVADLAQSIAGMGIISSGVRQIAEAAGSGDAGRIARTAIVLRRIALLLGLMGAALLVLLSGPVSRLSFGDDEHAGAIALLAAAVWCRVVSDGQGALLQGLQRIADLATMGILGALSGALLSVALVYVYGQQGVVPSLLGMAAMGILTSWWYSRKIPLPRAVLTVPEVRAEAAALLKLGFAFMASGLLMTGAAYAIRIMVLRRAGTEAAGLYQAAWGLGGMYVGLVLQAMGADFYPRLTALAHDHRAANRIVNEQAHVSLLLGGPGVLATLALAPWVIAVFYTPKFHGAVELLRWLCLGMTLRIVSWPMGFILLAKGAQGFFFWSEAAWTLVYLALAWIGVAVFGLDGAGMAFFGSYVFHCLMILWIVRHLTGFHWSAENRNTLGLYLALIAVVFCSFYVLPPQSALGIGLIAALLSGLYSLRILLGLFSGDQLPERLRKYLAWIRLKPGEPNFPGILEFIPTAAENTVIPASIPSPLRTTLSGFMIGTALYMWIDWYGRFYEWRQVADGFVPQFMELFPQIYRLLPITR